MFDRVLDRVLDRVFHRVTIDAWIRSVDIR